MLKGLLLEVISINQILKMSLVEREEHLPSLKSISSCQVDLSYIERICQEINSLLSQQNRTNSIGQEGIQELKKLGQLLFEYLLSKKIKERLREEKDIALILNVEESLISIPWELLHTGDDFLCLKFNLGRSITTDKEMDSPRLPKLSPPLRMLIVADTQGDLESSYNEGIKIKNFLLKYKDIHVDFKSSHVDSLYLKKNLREYDLFHFAGHCEFDPNEPLNTGLIFKDGRFTCKDILLFSHTESLPRMVFVNACQSTHMEQKRLKKETARYLYSFAHTFLLSGSQHYIGSSFKVNDELAAEFAQTFYKEILNGSSIGSALRQARLNLIKHYGLDTSAWADYTLYGDPDYILFAPSTYKRTYIDFKISPAKKRLLKLSISIVIAIVFLIFVFNYLNPASTILYQRSLNYFKKGKNEEVFKISQRILGIQPHYPLVYQLLGDTHFRLGRLDEALNNYFEYLRLAQKRKDRKNTASAYLKIAWTYHMQGDFSKAEDFYQKALELSIKNKDKLNEADTLSRLAVYYVDKKNFEKAFSFLIQSSQINQEKKQERSFLFNLACDYFNMGWIFSEMKDFEKAKEFYNKSKEIFMKLKEPQELSDYYFNMGEISRFEKRYQDALDYYQKGLEIDKKLSHYFNLSSDYQMLAELFWEMGKYLEAERYFQESLNLSQRIGNLPVLAEIYYDLGLFYKELNDLIRAKEYLIKAKALYAKMDLLDKEKIEKALLSLE
ncbi:MAG: tetratricopeptide repeat protein [Candidatus Omnitrophica bacterium]|nr:tetratricopeptide repeat protein [Candidatus Omnitrophota bacterium]